MKKKKLLQYILYNNVYNFGIYFSIFDKLLQIKYNLYVSLKFDN